ncbi:MFS transporter [Actinosynnema sp. NPDC047251]|uniref:Putative transporter n=1 Tax=Saccharothrix espanaensis (strain ATCC 51144 / DSM 44229 / JCM 9112 / NBRC 15066 / NRRL 15764) TaxID=1179773 RepID=K0KEV7_SACES|nr:MFS transporter [Saccharothrix espanaensis]CCH35048.1 putative transporter [Saccharothrix espanaensis DSM 44229]
MATTETTARFSGREWSLLLVLCGAIFLEGIDVAMMGVALPSIQAELGMSAGALQWVVSAYVLGYGGFMLLGGRAADLLGRRRVFLFWLAVFVVFSGLGGLAQDGWVLITARFVTGLSAAFLTPAGLSIITTTFTGPRRDQALLVYGGIGAAGFSLGMVVGGLLTVVGWRWVFFAPVVLALLILVASLKAIPKSADRATGRFDLAGAVTVTGGMVLLVLAIAEGVWPALVGGVALLAAFVVIERRTADPLVRLGILRSGPLLRANVSALLLAAAFFGFQLVAVLYLQQVLGWSALETGLALLVVGIDSVLAPTLTPRLVARFGLAPVVTAGLLLATASFTLFLRIDHGWGYWQLFPTVLLLGLAFALAYGPLTIIATDGIADAEQGLAGGLLNTSFQFGAALGVAGVTAVAALGDTPLEGYRLAVLFPVAAALVAALTASRGARRRSA